LLLLDSMKIERSDNSHPRRESPMAGDEKSREDLLKEMAARQGLVLAKSRHQPPDGESAGGYMLFDSASRAVAVFGTTSGRGPLDISDRGYQATLDEIEAYLRRGDN
jgi:hypothetical protein